MKPLPLSLFLVFFLHSIPLAQPAEYESKPVYRFALGLFHWNIQYVAGDKNVEDKIITENFEPLVDLFLRHPEWGADFEMQGYMIEVLGERFPKVLEKFRKLLKQGRVNLASFHYSDQLFLAFPRHDMGWSLKLLELVFKKYGVKRSGVVFTQEGQFGEGMIPVMKKHGYHTAVVAARLFKYFYPQEKNKPYHPFYDLNGVNIVLTDRAVFSSDAFQTDAIWYKFGDAEHVTSEKSPYHKTYRLDAEKLKAFEENIEKKEKEGWKVVNITEYVWRLKEIGIKPSPFPVILDATWKPDDSGNFFIWMGKFRSFQEIDVPIRSLNFRVRNKLLAAEVLIEWARKKKIKVKDEESWLVEGWKHQLLAEVSDSTGWFPVSVEIQYSFEESAKAQEPIKRIVESLKKKLKCKWVEVDTLKREVKLLNAFSQRKYEKAKCPLPVKVKSTGLKHETLCKKISASRTDYEFSFNPVEGANVKSAVISFPASFSPFVYSPALLEEELKEVDLSAFTFHDTYLAFSNGLVGIGKDAFLIKHNTSNHVAMKVDAKNRAIEAPVLNPGNDPFTWIFSVIRGKKEDALKEALKINVYPTVVL